MKGLIASVFVLVLSTQALAAKNSLYRSSRAQNRIQLYKEKTGHCFYKESVFKTNVGWKSNEEISQMSPRQRQYLKFKNNETSTRKVFVSKNLCSINKKSAFRN